MQNRIFTIKPEDHTPERLRCILADHPEVVFVSVVGVDLNGRDTDEKIPVGRFLEDILGFLKRGVQTDGSSVTLPGICALHDGRVDLLPDLCVNWYVDYDPERAEPLGTLRIPAYLYHNGKDPVGPRHMLREAEKTFCENVLKLVKEYPGAVLAEESSLLDDIVSVELTGATELEFWVKTPEDQANREQLFTSQELKEQYWQRTRGPVRTALEETLLYLDRLGIGVEMGHKEVGGIAAKLGAGGRYDHIMEQLEIDWRYASPMQAADNELLVRHTVKDIFRAHGLEVTFMAKPIRGVAGNGEHHHLGAALVLRDGRRINLFDAGQGAAESGASGESSASGEGSASAAGAARHYLSAAGYGALMGLLKNYAAVNGFVACTNDALNRLQPGFEAPVCAAASLGLSPETPTRNRTVLVGVIRSEGEPLATRFELRSPSPHSNSYLVFAAAYLAMLDGLEAVLAAGKTADELLRALCKQPGEPAFYLETERAYRAEENLFLLTSEERDRRYGKAPATVWEALEPLDPEALQNPAAPARCLLRCEAFSPAMLASYRAAMLLQWETELQSRLIPAVREQIGAMRKLPGASAMEEARWEAIESIRRPLARSTETRKSLLDRLAEALLTGDLAAASEMQKAADSCCRRLETLYQEYERNLR